MWKISAVIARRPREGRAHTRSPVLGGVVAEIAVTELGYVGLSVSDLSRWRVFAGEVLSMECVEAGDNLHLRMDYWNCR
jgi:hypothetical protein